MPAYFDSIKKGVATVMVSYSSWNGNKMHANQALITGFLKGKLRFRVSIKCYIDFSSNLMKELLIFYFCRALLYQIGRGSTGLRIHHT